MSDIEVGGVWSRHDDLKQVKVSSVTPTKVGWKCRGDEEEYFTGRNTFRITHDFLGMQKGRDSTKHLGGSCYVYKAKQPTWEE